MILFNDSGNKVKGFKDLASMGVEHFEIVFRAHEHENVGDILSVLAHFLRLVKDE